jgi:hypothetical protein
MIDHEARLSRIEKYLTAIAELGGNLPDERLTERTGPNDAVARGLMYVEARRLALEAKRIAIGTNSSEIGHPLT